MREAVIVDAVRTPLGRGKKTGALAGWHPVDLAAEPLKAIVDRTGIDPALIEDVIMGCVSQVGEQSLNVARNAARAAGYPDTVAGTSVDRQCGSSQQAAHFAAQGVTAGAYDCVVAAGVEVMSRVPMGVSASVSGAPFGPEMIGRYMNANLYGKGGLVPQKGKPVLQVENLSALNDKGFQALNGVSFTIHEGEIFGLAGISGNGQQELVEALAGLRDAQGGKVILDGADITHASSLERWQRGIGYVPADRIHVGSIGDFSLVENTAMNYYFDDQYARRGIVDYKNLRKLTEEVISEYGVAAPGPDIKAKNLSGGNLQKLILARVLSRKPRLVIADLPSQGLDVGATESVQNKLTEAKKNKAGVLLISEDLHKILSLSDWVAAIYECKIMGILPRRRKRARQAMPAPAPFGPDRSDRHGVARCADEHAVRRHTAASPHGMAHLDGAGTCQALADAHVIHRLETVAFAGEAALQRYPWPTQGSRRHRIC